MREMDKDVPSSFKIQIAIRNYEGKTLALLRHTPPTSTVDWLGSKPIQWEEDLKMPALKPGKYDLSLSVIDDLSGHKLNFLFDQTGKKSEYGCDIPLGALQITESR
jgi:hypothetical protein